MSSPVIDFHVHGFGTEMLPLEYYRGQADQLRARGLSTRTTEDLAERIRANATDPTGQLLLDELEAAGLDHAVIIGIDWALLSPDPAPGAHPRAHLEYFSQVVERSGGRVSAVLGVDPRRSDAVELVDEAFALPWVKGVKLYPPMGFSPLDEVCWPIYRRVVDTDRFALFHTGGQTYPFDMAHARVEPYARLQQAFPTMNLVLAHAGHPLWGPEALHVARGHPSTYLDVSGWNEETPEVSAAFLRRCFEVVGPGRIVFGSDFVAGRHSAGQSFVSSWRSVFESVAAEAGVAQEDFYAPAARLLRLEA